MNLFSRLSSRSLSHIRQAVGAALAVLRSKRRRYRGAGVGAFVKLAVFSPIICCSGLALSSPLPNRGFWVGYNEAWFGDASGDDLYWNWLSDNPVVGQAFAYPADSPLVLSRFDATKGVLPSYFSAMRAGNAKIVRIWLFPLLQGIQPSSYAPPNPPATPQTVGLTSDFLQNLERVLDVARVNGLRVYLTALNGVDMANVFGANPFMETYFRDLLLNVNGETNAFKAHVLRPLLHKLDAYNRRHPGVLYAFDVINEMEGPVSVGYLSIAEARNWIRDMALFVKAHSSLPVTASAGYGYAVQEITFGLYSGLGLDFYDAHIYSDSGTYPGQSALCARVRRDRSQIILGEYGQSTPVFDDRRQVRATVNFLKGAKRSCFSSALAWKFETPNRASDEDPAPQYWFSYVRRNDDGSLNPHSLAFRPAYNAVKSFGGP